MDAFYGFCMDKKAPESEVFAPPPIVTGGAVTAIIVLGLGDVTAWAIPLGIVAGGVATYASALSTRKQK